MQMILRTFAGLWLVLAASAGFAQEPAVLTVTGQGSVQMQPDMALITLGVRHNAKTAQEAVAMTSEAMAAILVHLEEMGIEARDLQTSGFSLNPSYTSGSSSGERRIDGYIAENMLNVRVRDLDQLGVILDGVIGEGANDFRGLRFALQEPRPALDEARRLAVLDARAKAELLADAAGLDLGAVLSLSEHGGSAGPVMMEADFARAMSAVPVAGGEVGSQAEVTMIFEIIDKS